MKSYQSNNTTGMTKAAAALLLSFVMASTSPILVEASVTVGTTRIAGYQTKSSVTGSAIDLDQAEMERHLDVGDFEKAGKVFRGGAHMKPYASVRLEQPVSHDVVLSPSDQKSVRVIGLTSANGDGVDGGDIVDAKMILGQNSMISKGSTSLWINYVVTEDQYHNKQIPCAVGGRSEPNLDGCLAASGGLIIEGYGAVNYHYDPLTENGFQSTLYGFSQHEAEKMFHCKDHCPYPEYEKFYKYYGQMDYGNLWIEAALAGTETTFAKGVHFTHGNVDFSELGVKGRAEAVKTATVTMNMFTHVNRIMTEWSVDKCHRQCDHKGDSNPLSCPQAAEPWDDAVANYAGSLEGSDGTGKGYLLYGLADQLCQDFKTCGSQKSGVTGTSGVNVDIVNYFQQGRQYLEGGYCDNAQHIKFKIDQSMTIPLIQATLRSAYKLQYTTKQTEDEEWGRALAFMASVLPDIHHCSPEDAQILYDQMTIGSTPSFGIVKKALERTYNCMSIQCNDVGGLIDPTTGNYYKGAEPCQRRLSPSQSSSSPPSSNSHSANRIKDFASQGVMVFLMCNVVVLIALVVKHQRWVPAISSQIDSILESSSRSVVGFDESSRRGGPSSSYSLDGRSGNYEPVVTTPYTNAARDGGMFEDGSERSHSNSTFYSAGGGDLSNRDDSTSSGEYDLP